MEWKIKRYGDNALQADFTKGEEKYFAKVVVQGPRDELYLWWVYCEAKYHLIKEDSGQGTTLLQTLQEIESKWGNQ